VSDRMGEVRGGETSDLLGGEGEEGEEDGADSEVGVSGSGRGRLRRRGSRDVVDEEGSDAGIPH
jgi:hypothetical protein